MTRSLKQTILLSVSCTLALSGRYSAQLPNSVTCKFERIATAGLEGTKITTSSEADSGDLVLANLNSTSPTAAGNVGAVTLQVLRRSNEAIWLAEMKPNEVASTTTLFLKTGIVMFSKHEILHTVDGDQPFGFVEIGRCKPLQ
ncbi:MAG TPA: hypothetical protein VJN96_20870 [Vicinamibacterales bacterium]|nr:hypothetical protein [Vicinamibacterales bacterium]